MTTGIPEQGEIDAAYEQQKKQRFVYIENRVIDDSFGVFDYDAEIWVKEPFLSLESAKQYCLAKNRGAKRL